MFCYILYYVFFHLVSAGKVELAADQLVNIKYQLNLLYLNFVKLEQIESNRDLTQIIVHVDMDAFYAVRTVALNYASYSSFQNVELLDNPKLAGKPFGVSHPIVSCARHLNHQ